MHLHHPIAKARRLRELLDKQTVVLPGAFNALTAMQIERAYPGYHVWISDAGWWYATRTHPRARGQSPTVHGSGPGELSTALAEEEAVTLGRAMGGSW